MKVFLIKTPEYDTGNFNAVQELLKSLEEPLKFIIKEYEFNPDQFPFLQNAEALSWSELFSLCNFYRKTFSRTFSIANTDFIVLLTKRGNKMNFFSMFDDKHNNAFVQTSGWDFIKAHQKYPIAYEVVANILRSLMKLPHSFPNPLIHKHPLGCINDYCKKKSEILLKLRTADICNNCLAKMRVEKVDDEIIDQSLAIFEEIRKQILFKQGFTKNVTPKVITVDTIGKIMVGDKEIILEALKKTLFIFFLNHNQGISLYNLEKHKKKLLYIYKKIRPGALEAPIDRLVKSYLKPNGTFSKNKSQLNKELKRKIGEPLYPFYRIDGNPGDAFKMDLDPKFIVLDPAFIV